MQNSGYQSADLSVPIQSQSIKPSDCCCQLAKYAAVARGGGHLSRACAVRVESVSSSVSMCLLAKSEFIFIRWLSVSLVLAVK
jgi:hypothetical protein